MGVLLVLTTRGQSFVNGEAIACLSGPSLSVVLTLCLSFSYRQCSTKEQAYISIIKYVIIYFLLLKQMLCGVHCNLETCFYKKQNIAKMISKSEKALI